ncbi:PAS domain-containing protein [Thermodesulfobacteriota bacterium]
MFYRLFHSWKLKTGNSSLKSIVDNMFDGIGVLDNKGNVTQANRSFVQMLGYEEEGQVIGKNMTEFTVREDVPKVISAMEKGAEKGFIRDLKVIGITKDGKNYHASINATLVKSKTGDTEWIGVVRDTTELAKLEKEKNELIEKLQKALAEVKTLRGILPICSFCKKIRDDKGYWEQVDVYIHKYSEADISHSICPECMKKNYPDEYE